MKHFISILFKVVGGLFVLLMGAIIACTLIGITVDLSGLRSSVETAATRALGRKVKISGPVVFKFSTWPYIDLRGLQIANPPGSAAPIFLEAGHAKLEVALLPLLKKDIRIGKAIAEDVALNLESNEKEPANEKTEKTKPQKPEPSGKKEKAPHPSGGLGITLTGLDNLTLKNITVTYYDAALKKTVKFHLDMLEGKAPPKKPATLAIKGNLQAYPYDLKILGEPIDVLLAKSMPWSFTLKGEIAGKKIGAKGVMAARAATPRIDLSFDIHDINVGAILSTLGVIKGLQAKAGNAGIKLTVRGGNLNQILKDSRMTFTITDGSWDFVIPKTGTKISMTHLSGAILVDKGKPVALNLKGALDDYPLELKIVGASLLDFVATPENIPLLIDIRLSKMHFHFSSVMALPMSSHNLKMTLKISGDRLDRLNNLLKLKLPGIGPLSLDAKMAITPKGYDLSSLKVTVGKSQLNGRVNLDLSGNKPKVKASFLSELLRIDDFVQKEKNMGSEKPKAAPSKQPRQVTANELKKEVEKKHASLLSHKFLNRLDGEVTVEARRVTSLKDNLGSGLMKVSLEDGQLRVSPLQLHIPGGKIDLSLDYKPSPQKTAINFKADIDKFDFGVLARRAKPGTKMGGKFSMSAELHATAPKIEDIMKSAQGYFNFFLVPKNFSAGIIDLWAVNLLSAIMTKATQKDKSKINCLVVGLSMKDGLMKDKAIYMDTTKMRIVGKAQIDFKARKIDILLVPKAKRPEFFSLAIPIKVNGSFNDFSLGVNKLQLVGSAFSFITSPIHVPLRRLFSKQIPANGREACLEAWKKTKRESRNPKNGKNP